MNKRVFPDFNIYSTPLLVLTLQGLVFIVLLIYRFYKRKNNSDWLLALILFITCYHQTAYTIGFMGWYDTFRNTKINYYLVNLSLALAPLIYFYFRSVTNPQWKLKRKDFLHFIPITILVIIRLFILIYDANQIGFSETQNGELVVGFQWKFLDPIEGLLSMIQMIVYLVLSFQLLYSYREKIKHYFSNTYNLELNWLHHFLIVYSILFLYNSFQTVIDEIIIDLSWIQEWWYYFLSGLVIIYVAIRGYFTDLSQLKKMDVLSYLNEENKILRIKFQTNKSDQLSKKQEEELEKVRTYFENEKPYLEPDLTLPILAKKLLMTREQLSKIINKGFQSKFNDFINEYRVNEIKESLYKGKHKQFSLLGIAYECGFNSKATFNRAFKKHTGKSPSAFVNSID